jgi:uncharacterized membrane protein YcjF (UPF0283 family)
MTVESLMNTFTQYISWLYSERQWATWELQTIAITALVLLLLIMIVRRKARTKKAGTRHFKEHSSTIGINLDEGKEDSPGLKGDLKTHRIVSISKGNGNQKRWKETTKKWKNYQRLIEQLQQETVRYKQDEERLEQQFAKLKAANEQLRQAINGSNLLIQESELSRPRSIDSFEKEQGRILNTSEVIPEKR